LDSKLLLTERSVTLTELRKLTINYAAVNSILIVNFLIQIMSLRKHY